KGDNVNASAFPALGPNLFGSQILTQPALDANGNAAALPLASFFNTNVTDTVKLRDLIQAQHPTLAGCFHSDAATSDEYQAQFSLALNTPLTQPSTHERNKQLLWPQQGYEAIASDDYVCLVPLHPSALTHALYQRINPQRYSEANKLARDNRKKKTPTQAPYLSMHDLAYVQLGGTKPQNISQLTSGQGGKNYLLPSLPPRLNAGTALLPTKQQQTLFDHRLKYHCRWGIETLIAALSHTDNTMAIRAQRDAGIDLTIGVILSSAQHIQQTLPAGWSRGHQLNMAEKYWLDPHRGDLEDEALFQQQRAQDQWQPEIEQQFGLWLNGILQKAFPKQAIHFTDTERLAWRQALRAAIKASQRREEGVF
ncbi:MAG: type I-F CRISPR-associated protein Csy1, partial [Neisseriaceae bacterium]|nr:type I-F CRISPR-associated protein Csy1 [Neisseriaceae bacterium]